MINDLRWWGDCLLCWYWWNYWPSLFKRSFHNIESISSMGQSLFIPYWSII